MASSRRLPAAYNESTYDSAGGGEDYTSLATWEAATDIDLVTATDGEVLTCTAGSHADSVVMAGATTNSSYFRVIRGAVGTATPSAGVRFTSASTTANFILLSIQENYSGMYDTCGIFTVSSTAIRYVFHTTGVAYTKFVGCIAKGPASTGRLHGFTQYINTSANYFIDCVAIDMGSNTNAAGFWAYISQYMYVYNCTVVGTNYAGFKNTSSSNLYLKNSAAQGCTDNIVGAWNETTNVESDAVVFAADGYHLDSTDEAAIGAGTDLSGDGVYAFDDDIDGETRVAWDVGADEFLVPGEFVIDNISCATQINRYAVESNLNSDENFDVDFTDWTDLSNGGSKAIVTNNVANTGMPDYAYLTATADYHATIERAFTVGASEDWMIETDIAYATSGKGKIEILNSSNEVLVTLLLGDTADQIDFFTDLSSGHDTAVFADGLAVGRRIMIHYNFDDETICIFYTKNEGGYSYGVPTVQVGSAKAITPATSLKIRYTALAGSTDNKLYIDNCTIFTPDFVAIGDSYIQGYNVWGNDPVGYTVRNDRYASCVNYFSKKFPDYYINNWAFGGSSLSSVEYYDCLTNILKTRPKKIWIEYGHNDIVLAGQTFTQMKASFENLLAEMYAYGLEPKDIIVGNCIASYYFASEAAKARLEEWNDWLETRRNEEGFFYIDTRTICADPTNLYVINPDYDAGDELHPNAAGHTAIANGLEDVLEYLLLQPETGGEFVIADLASTSSIENIALTQGGGTLAMADLASLSSIENIDLAQSGGTLEIDNIDSTSSIEEIELIGNFVVSNLDSVSTIDNVILERNGGDLVIEDLSSLSSIDNVSIQQEGSLLVADIECISSIENIDLSQNSGEFVIEDLLSSSSIENIELIGNLVIDDIDSLSSIENIDIEFNGGSFEIDNLDSLSSIDQITLIQEGSFIIDGIECGSSIDNITLEINGGEFAIGNLDSLSSIENIELSFNGGEFQIGNLDSTSTIENITLENAEVSTYSSNKPLLIDSIGGKVLQLGGNKMPTWNTAGRPTGKTGEFGFNTETSKLEVYANDTWNIIN